MKSILQTIAIFLLLFTFAAPLKAQMAKHASSLAAGEAPTLIRLSQTEGEYTTKSLNLKPGDYIFEVTNVDVDKGLGFYLQDATDAQVNNSGLASLVGAGKISRTGVVTLTEGSYRYSCPLNPTPHYAIEVGAPRVIHLNQTEGVYETSGLNLAPGYYVFEVENLSVDKDLGFYLQDATDAQVNNSGLAELVGKGETSRSGLVYLAAGDYQYSCPLNPTPHYQISVR